jgi:hypothetical protein
MRRMYPLLLAAILALLLAGCGAKSNENGATDVPKALPSAVSSLGIEPTVNTGSDATESPTETVPTESQNDPDAQLKATAHEVVEYLRDRDLNSLIPFIDPELGLRFSPYPHINTDTDLVFQSDTLPSFKDTKKLKWGTADGSGEPIELSFRDYYERFVYNKDFADAPSITANKLVGTGNSPFNGSDVYPNASYVEFHYPGFDEKLDGMDWQSLILVFVPAQDQDGWNLAAVVHGQWTI